MGYRERNRDRIDKIYRTYRDDIYKVEILDNYNQDVLLGIDKAPKPIKKKPRRRPVVRDVTFIPDPTYFYLFVNDFETEEPLDAMVKVFTLGEVSDTIFAGMTDKETGFVEEQIDNGQYGISITRPGYIDYSDTLFRVISDTLYVDLQPIKKNTVVILRNLLFDT